MNATATKPLEVERGLCQCGCGQPTKLASKTSTKAGWVKGQPLAYLHGHGHRKPTWILRECAHCHRFARIRPKQRFCSLRCVGFATRAARLKGKEHPHYNGGLSFHRGEQRWSIVCRDGTKLRYARGVMAAHIGRLLLPHEVVHHINGDSTDDRIENLKLLTQSEHIELHRDAMIAARRAKA